MKNKFEYTIKILKQEIFRLNDKCRPMFTIMELEKFEDYIRELKQAIKILESEVNNGKKNNDNRR